VAALLLKASHKEQRSVIRFLWAKGLNANLIQSEMRPVFYETSNTMFGVKLKSARGRE